MAIVIRWIDKDQIEPKDLESVIEEKAEVSPKIWTSFNTEASDDSFWYTLRASSSAFKEKKYVEYVRSENWRCSSFQKQYFKLVLVIFFAGEK